MEHKTYLKFLSQITSAEAGCLCAFEIKIFFRWYSEKGQLVLSSILSENAFPHGSKEARQLKWRYDQPYFDQQGEHLFLSQNIHGIPTFSEFKDVIKNFVDVYQEFNDQSMGSLAQLLR